eukprot:1075909-Prymnesium_polylepis.1
MAHAAAKPGPSSVTLSVSRARWVSSRQPAATCRVLRVQQAARNQVRAASPAIRAARASSSASRARLLANAARFGWTHQSEQTSA